MLFKLLQSSKTINYIYLSLIGIYFRNFYAFGSGAVGVNPIEAAIHFRTLQQVVDKIQDSYGSSSSEESGEKNQYMKKVRHNKKNR